MSKELKKQIEVTRMSLLPDSLVLDGCIEVTNLIDMFFNYLEKNMDKKMHKVSKKIETAEKDIKKGKKAEAVKVLKKAVKKNEKLVKIDKTQRDPVIHAVEKAGKCKGKACASKVKKLVKKGK
jgi:23S rRNA pseudoU1915 N3-methylase RlmH